MYHYSVMQWLFFFYLYCFFGWIFESTYVSIKSRKCVNRGFMRGPFLPIYGSGAIMMLVVSMPFQNHVILTYFSGCVGATLLELVTGEVMEALFKVRYWDYSNQPFNYKGHICLSSTVAWGFLTIFMTEYLHRGIDHLASALPYTAMAVITSVVSVVVIVDFTLSFKAAMELRDLLVGLEKAKAEMERIQKRLDVLIAVANDELENVREDVREDVREEIAELRGKFAVIREHRIQFGRLRSFYQRSLINGNPTMKSRFFEEAMEELKRAAQEWKKGREEENRA